jgi:hypothetical protein
LITISRFGDRANEGVSMILFLDFDGVLHPETISFGAPGMVRREDHFSRVPLFEEVMREFEDIDIVISSAWREVNSLDTLRGFFSEDIASRIIDTTPVLSAYSDARREKEILLWMNLAGRQSEPIIAVDDWPTLFSPDCRFLFRVDPERALDRATADALRQRLNALKRR